jgi:hypothetical protein
MNDADARPSGYSLAMNFVPLLFLVCGAALAWRVGAGAAMAWVYVLPPVAGRLLIALFGRPQGEALGQDSRPYKVWWLIAQLQMPFNRFGFLEELLRLVPGLYALWLNLWGSAVSPVVFWGPGVQVLDRYALRVGRGAVIGTRAVLSGHLGIKDQGGAFRVTLAPLEIGAGALIGANAGIGPGCSVAAGDEVPAATFLRPFTRWEAGARVKTDRPRSA